MYPDRRELRRFKERLPPPASEIVPVDRRALLATEDPTRELCWSISPFYLTLEIVTLSETGKILELESGNHHALIEADREKDNSEGYALCS